MEAYMKLREEALQQMIPAAESDQSTTTNRTMSDKEIWRRFRKAQQELNQLMKEAGEKHV